MKTYSEHTEWLALTPENPRDRRSSGFSGVRDNHECVLNSFSCTRVRFYIYHTPYLLENSEFSTKNLLLPSLRAIEVLRWRHDVIHHNRGNCNITMTQDPRDVTKRRHLALQQYLWHARAVGRVSFVFCDLLVLRGVDFHTKSTHNQ